MTPYIIAIAGPSGAGKSVFCRLMQTKYANVSRLKLDDFFVGFDRWDHPDSLKWDGLIQAARDLKENKPAIVPNYSRKIDRQIGEKCVFPAEIILLDGFMSLVNDGLRELIDLKIYFNLSEDSQIKRRKLRQPWVEKVYLEHIMIPASRQFLFPSMKHADYVINAELAPTGVAEACLGIIQAEINKKKKIRLQKTINIVTAYETHFTGV